MRAQTNAAAADQAAKLATAENQGENAKVAVELTKKPSRIRKYQMRRRRVFNLTMT